MKLYPPGVAWFAYLILAMAVGACATTSLEQRLYGVQVAFTEVQDSAIELRNEKVIPDEAWPHIRQSLRDAEDGIKKAKNIYKDNVTGAYVEIHNVDDMLNALRKAIDAYRLSLVH